MGVAESDFASLIAQVDKINVDKLKADPPDLSKLTNIVRNDVKKTVYDQLVTKVNAIATKLPSTSGLVSKIQFDSEKWNLEKKI